MKTNFLPISVFIMALSIIWIPCNAGQKHSTSTGGNWNSPGTWIENVVPGANDTVTVSGPAAVYVNASALQCAALIVNIGATLRQVAGYSYELTVIYDITNYGTITNSSGNLDLKAGGNIHNQGTFSNRKISLTGATVQTLSCSPGYSMNIDFLVDLAGGSPVIMNTPIVFNGTSINLASASCSLQGIPTGNDLVLNGGNMTNINLNANNLSIRQNLGFTIAASVNITDATFRGKTIISASTDIFSGHIIIHDTLKNFAGYSFPLTIDGNLTNNGIIYDASGNLTLNITGDITNAGVISNYTINLTGTTPQHIYENSGKFACSYFNVQVSSGPVYLDSDIHFEGTSINFNNDSLVTPPDKKTPNLFSFKGCNIKQTVIRGKAGDQFYMGYGSYLHTNVHVFDMIMNGKIKIYNTGNKLAGTIVISDTLRNLEGYNQSLLVDGDITNNGLIMNSSGNLTLNITGDIFNNGIFDNITINLTGSAPQYITESGGKFSCNNFNVAASSGPVYLNSDIHFEGTTVDFNNDTLYSTLNKTTGQLFQFKSGYLTETIIKGKPGDVFYMGYGAYIHTNVHLMNMTLHGTVRIYNTGNILSGSTTVSDTLRNLEGYNPSLTVRNSLYNEGAILNSNGNLTIALSGDLTNNGSISNNLISLTGTSDQHMLCVNNKKITINYLTDNAAANGNLIADGDLLFHTTVIDLNGADLYMSAGYRLQVTGSSTNNGYMTAANIKGDDFTFDMNTNSYLFNVNCTPSVVFNGTVKIYGICTFSKYIIVSDSLRNLPGYSSTLNVGTRLTNNGLIFNTSGNLTINCQGDLINNGFWTNNGTYLNGIQNQFIFLIGNKPISSSVRFTVPGGQAPYQWYYNGAILNSPDFSGETSSQLVWLVPVQQSWFGNFWCLTSTGQSRMIRVGGGLLADMKVNLEGPFNGIDMDANLNGSGYIPLNHPYSGSPWYYTGTESVTAIPDADVVDWVLVELRVTSGGPETATPATTVARQAAFILKGGRIVGTDGANELQYDLSVTGNLYPVIWHRNHLAVMSSVPVTQNGIAYNYDFTSGPAQVYGGVTGHKEIAAGIWGMISGDGNSDGVIANNDKNNVWKVQVGLSGYLAGDFNMNGQVDNGDKNNKWKPNSGFGSQVPD